MPLVPPLPVAVPLLVAALLVAVGPFVRRRVADLAAIATAVTTTVLTALLLARAADHPLVHWFGGWTPRDGLVLGIDFAVDPVCRPLAGKAETSRAGRRHAGHAGWPAGGATPNGPRHRQPGRGGACPADATIEAPTA